MSKLRILLIILTVWSFSSCNRLSEAERQEWSRGKEVYLAHCVSCHGADGKGLGGAYPSLTRTVITSDFSQRAKYLINNGSPGMGGMLAIPISTKETMEVINYIQNAWGNEAEFETLGSNNL